MSKDSTPPPGGGLLSKMVKFVKSPTTHWSDLDRPTDSASDTESRMALKEMIERKRRNDFVRNREFDMLRKARRKETQRDGELPAGGPSFYPSSQPADTGERARTLKKIDEIEASMATAWFKRKTGAAPLTAEQAARPAARAERSTRMPLGRPSAAGALGAEAAHAPAAAQRGAAAAAHAAPADDALAAQVPAFSPTITMNELAAIEEAMPQAPLPGEGSNLIEFDLPAGGANEPKGAPASAPAPLFTPAAGGLFGNDFNVEVVAAARHDPEIEEAAMRFANGDEAGAEAVLLGLVAQGAARHTDLDTWLTLFDLYRCVGDQTKFDDAAFDFAAIFGRSAPQWALVTDAAAAAQPGASAPAPMTPAQSMGLFNWTSPSTLGTQSIAALKATLARHPPPWRIDWRHIKTIEPAALGGLIEVLHQWADTAAARVKFLGDERLLALLAEQSPTDDRTVDPQWWEARMALLRLQNQVDEFELVALNYCVTYEVSPPAWEPPRSSYNPLDEEGQTLPPPEGDTPPTGAPDSVPPTTQPFAPSGFPGTGAGDDCVRAALDGTFVGTAQAALDPLLERADVARGFELNCRGLVRVDFGAAGDLLNFALEQQAASKAVTFKQVNRLVAAFFGVVGITDAARVLLRTD